MDAAIKLGFNILKFFKRALMLFTISYMVLLSDSLLSLEDTSLDNNLETVDDKNYQCDADFSWTKLPPFSISDSFGNDGTFPVSGQRYEHNWDNFRQMEDSAGVIGFIPQRSIVRLINPEHKGYVEDASKKMDARVRSGKVIRLPVEIVSVPKNGGRQFVNRYKTELKKILKSDGSIVKEKMVGRIDSRSLQPAGKFTYLITKPTFLTQLAGLDATEAGRAKAVELVTQGDGSDIKYEARKCCLVGRDPKCVFRYRWRVLDDRLKEMSKFEVNPFSDKADECGIMDNLRPLDKTQAQPILEILKAAQSTKPGATIDDLEFIDSMGLVRFPWEYNKDGDDIAIEGPYNSSHYAPDGGQAMYDSFINATTGCAFTNVLREWNRKYPSSKDEIQVGNMWHPKSWGTHKSHEQARGHGAQGTCLDIRPLSTNSRRGGLNVNSGNYSRARSREFIQLMRKAGADPVYLNDSKIPESSFMKGHSDHIHVCFNPSKKAVQNACQNGL